MSAEPTKDAPPPDMRLSISRAKDAKFVPQGLRDFFEYRDLGIKDSTSGQAIAHVIRAKRACEEGTGDHRHGLTFQMFYVLKGNCAFRYEGHGRVELEAGDCVHQPPGIVHDLISCSEDCTILEVCLPADFSTEDLSQKTAP